MDRQLSEQPPVDRAPSEQADPLPRRAARVPWELSGTGSLDHSVIGDATCTRDNGAVVVIGLWNYDQAVSTLLRAVESGFSLDYFGRAG